MLRSLTLTKAHELALLSPHLTSRKCIHYSEVVHFISSINERPCKSPQPTNHRVLYLRIEVPWLTPMLSEHNFSSLFISLRWGMGLCLLCFCLGLLGSLGFLCHWAGRGDTFVFIPAELVLLFLALFWEWTSSVIDTDNNSNLFIQKLYSVPSHWARWPLGSQWLPWNWIDSVHSPPCAWNPLPRATFDTKYHGRKSKSL